MKTIKLAINKNKLFRHRFAIYTSVLAAILGVSTIAYFCTRKPISFKRTDGYAEFDALYKPVTEKEVVLIQNGSYFTGVNKMLRKHRK
jgi:hypothetical protein